MVKILNCYLYAKKSYGTLSKGAIFFGQPCISSMVSVWNPLRQFDYRCALQLNGT